MSMLITASHQTRRHRSVVLHRAAYTGTNGTLITAYTPDYGSSYTLHTGGADIQSGRGHITALNETLVSTSTGRSDMEVSFTFRWGTLVNGSSLGLLIRFVDVNNFWQVFLRTGEFTIYRRITGTTSSVVTTPLSISANTDVTVTAQAREDTIKASVGATTLSTQSNLLQTATRAGVRAFCNVLTDNLQFDNLLVRSL